MSCLEFDINQPVVYHSCMRTTLNLEEDVARLVREYAESRSLSLGKAASELVRRGLTTPRRTRVVNGLEVFDLPADSQKVSTKRVRELEAEDE